MEQDQLTRRQAHIIAHHYGFWPVEPLMCERTIPPGTTRTLFFCDVPNDIRILVKYNRDELEEHA